MKLGMEEGLHFRKSVLSDSRTWLVWPRLNMHCTTALELARKLIAVLVRNKKVRVHTRVTKATCLKFVITKFARSV